MKRKGIIIDLDDCLFDSRHLGKYLPERADDREGWDLFQEKMNDCKVNEYIDTLIKAFMYETHCEIIFITGREGNKRMKEITEENLKKLGYLIDNVYYRKEGDYRRSAEVKKEIYLEHIRNKYNVLFAIDDDVENIKMFQKLGINTLHCRYGKGL